MTNKRNLTMPCLMFMAATLLSAFASAPLATNYWMLDTVRGGIVHTVSDGEPVVLCMQGRKVVMQVRVDSATGLSYKARFFHVDPDLSEKGWVIADVRDDSIPTLLVNGRPLRCDAPSTVAFDGMLTVVYPANEGIVPFPGSFEGTALNLTQRERGDDVMVLYGLSKFLLFQGDRAAAEEMWPLIEFAAASVLSHTAADGIIASETDEMEERYATGTANLSTSSLAYGGYRQAACLAQSLGKAIAAEFNQRAAALSKGIESYFGAEVEGFKTYRYYKENTTLRGWILLLAMGITERQEATVGALMSDKLWPHRLAGAEILAESTRQ